MRWLCLVPATAEEEGNVVVLHSYAEGEEEQEEIVERDHKGTESTSASTAVTPKHKASAEEEEEGWIMLGRARWLGLSDKRISRNHLRVKTLPNERAVLVCACGVNAMKIHHVPPSSSSTTSVIDPRNAEDRHKMNVGDKLWLLHPPSSHPFTLRLCHPLELEEKEKEREVVFPTTSSLSTTTKEERTNNRAKRKREAPDEKEAETPKLHQRAGTKGKEKEEEEEQGKRYLVERKKVKEHIVVEKKRDHTLVPMRWTFGEQGASVQVIDLTSESTDVTLNKEEERGSKETNETTENKVAFLKECFPQMEDSTIEAALIYCRQNVTAAVNHLLGNGSSSASSSTGYLLSATTPPTEAELKQNEKEAREWFRGSQVFFRLNRLPFFPETANEGSIQINHIITEDARFALISSYSVDVAWLMEQCPVLRRIRWTLIHGEQCIEDMIAGLESQDSSSAPTQQPSNVHFHKPYLPFPYGTVHTKMMLVFFDDSLRVAITTANLIDADYERKTQGIWVQDFPRASPSAQQQTTELSREFVSYLTDYLRKMGRTSQLGGFDPVRLRDYDFSQVKVRLVASVPGVHRGAEMNKYGHMRIRSLLRKACPSLSDSLAHSPLLCQFSSVGSLTADWLKRELVNSFCPETLNEGGSQTSKSSSNALPDTKLIWPTVDFVRDSVDGYAAGGSLCFPQRNLKPFMLPLFHRYTAMQKGREHVTPHIKCYTRANEEGQLGWVCLTSANLSKAAWGNLQKNDTQLMIRNWELGVLFLPSDQNSKVETTFMAGTSPSVRAKRARGKNEEKAEEEQVITFPMPYSIPPPVYEQGKDEAWLWDVPHPEPDSGGHSWRTM
ncbi:tyrosyl-DNA phosphodiesterase 1 [Balamuthia mandrillaris]